MKKVLLATTAVALSAGVAYAEVSFSGDARMGLQYADNAAPGFSSTTIEKRMTVNIDATTESSSGITFGARMRLRSNENGGPTGFSGARVFMSTGGLEIGAGNINGAIGSMPGMYNSEVGLTALNDAGVVVNTVANPATAWGYDGFSSNGNGAEGFEAIYTAGGFTGHLSFSGDQLRGLGTTAKRTAAYGAYTFNDWTVALGVQNSSVANEDKTALVVSGTIGDYGVGFAAADNNGERKIAINGSATFGATTVNGFIADEESGLNTAYGIGVSYDLGGAAVMGGIEKDAAGVTRADVGVSFSF
jgi:outer membrane protein OmpU